MYLLYYLTLYSSSKFYKDELDGTVLAKQLEQTVSDLHRVTKLHQKVHEEKCILEKKLFEEKNTNRMHLEHIDELKVGVIFVDGT